MHNKFNKKKIIKMIIVLIIIEVICILTINVVKTKQEENISNEEKLAKLKVEESEYIYTKFDNIINQFLEYIKKQNAEALIAILDEEFIVENQLNKQNILDYFEKYTIASKYKSKEIYSQKITLTQIYRGEYTCIKGSITTDKIDEDIFFLIKQDYINSAFSISIIEEHLFEKMKKTGKINENLEINIEKNNYNKIDSKINNL